VRYAFIAVSTTVIVALVAVSVVYFADVGVGRPLRHELPPGYRGWALVEYQRPDCPGLYVQGLRLIVTYDVTGRACTSSQKPLGWRYRTFAYVEPNGTRRPIPEELLRSYSYSIGDNADTFFVGTDAEFATDRTPLDKRYRNK
jgi:hypothetical protein